MYCKRYMLLHLDITMKFAGNVISRLDARTSLSGHNNTTADFPPLFASKHVCVFICVNYMRGWIQVIKNLCDLKC